MIQLNQAAYQQLVDENLAWLNAHPADTPAWEFGVPVLGRKHIQAARYRQDDVHL